MLSKEFQERCFFNGTGEAIAFLQKITTDSSLADACSRTDLEGRLHTAENLGFHFTEENMRGAIRTWDFTGEWRKWLAFGRMSESIDDLPDLDNSYAITEEQINTYQRDGHLLLKEIISRVEMNAYRPVVRRAVSQFSATTPVSQKLDQEAYREAGHISAFNLRQADAGVLKFVLARRFGKIAADLMGVDAVRVYMDEAFYKEPGNGITHWHQDRTYFPPDSDDLMTMWIPLVDISENMGSLIFATGSHHLGDLGYHSIANESSVHFNEFIEQNQLLVTCAQALNIGEATVHNGWCLHSAGPNESHRTREVITIVYYPDGTRIDQPKNPYHERAIKLSYPGKMPGELANGPIHPIAYQRSAGV